jgi:hypothetical protein
MPRLRPKFPADAVVRCWQPFAAADGKVYNRSTRLRGDDDAVRRHPDLFALETDPDGDYLADVTSSKDRAGVTVNEGLKPEDAAVAIESFYANGRFITRGQVIRRTDELVVAHPHFFESQSYRLDKEPDATAGQTRR